MSLHTRRHALRFTVAAAIWLTIVWVLLWGDLTVGNLVAGLALALFVGFAFRMPTVEFLGRLHPVGLGYLVFRFLVDLTVASVQVAALALTPGRRPLGAVIAVRLRSDSDLYLTLTGLLTSLVPGSIVVDADRATGTLYVHILDVRMVGGLEAARHHVLSSERRILRALASRAELVDAGLARPRGERGRP